VAHVVEQNSEAGTLEFALADFDALCTQLVEGRLHQVEAAQGVVEAIVHGARIDQMTETEL
jgi:hypothetical protein